MDLGKIANWASIAGLLLGALSLIVTLWVAREIARVRAAYFRRVRLPELAERLSELNSELSDQLNNFDANRDAVHRCISQIHELAKSILTKLDKRERGATQALVDSIDPGTISELAQSAARSVYLRAIAMHESISNLSQDLVWK